MYWVYILQSQSDQSFYVGFSSNIDNRLQKHNSAKSGYTAKKQPWKVVYQESFENKREAIIRERYIKSQKDKSFIIKLIQTH